MIKSKICPDSSKSKFLRISKGITENNEEEDGEKLECNLHMQRLGTVLGAAVYFAQRLYEGTFGIYQINNPQIPYLYQILIYRSDLTTDIADLPKANFIQLLSMCFQLY